jgi:glycosyltransferase involved in cell wall biosynthesis
MEGDQQDIAPFFSIVIPSYNRAELLPKTLDSVFAQRFQAFEVFVVDDDSKDNTAEIVEGYRQKDSRIRYLPKENGERGAARNYGAKYASGKYITFHDSDDIMYPDYLEESYRLIQAHQEPEVATLNYDVITPEGKLLKSAQTRPKNLNLALISGNMIAGMAHVRKDIFARHPFIEDRALAGSEDWELWLRLACRYNIVHSGRVGTGLVQHKDRSVMEVDIDKLLQRRDALIRYRLQDEVFLQYYRSKIPLFLASNYTYIALHLTMAGKAPRTALHYLLRALWQHPSTLFTRRTVNILRFLSTRYYRRLA